MNLALNTWICVREENPRKIGVPFNSLLPILSKLAITGCREISCPCVMSRFGRFCFEGADCASGVRCLCGARILTPCVPGPLSSGQGLFAILVSHFRTRRMHPNVAFEKEFCRIKNKKRLSFKIVSFLDIRICLET